VNFELNKEQQQIKKAAKDFVKGEFKQEVIHDLVKNRTYPSKILKKAGKLGFSGVHFPEEYGGEGLSPFEQMLVAEELTIGHSTVGVCLALSGYGTDILLSHGSERQKQTWIPRVAKADVISSCAFTEPGPVENFEDYHTTAVKDGDSWVINGGKRFVVNGEKNDKPHGGKTGFYIVLCKTDFGTTTPEKGLSTILVEADRQGVSSVNVGNILGTRLLPLTNVDFNTVRVPLENLIGKEHEGHSQVMEFFNHSRVLIASMAVGMAQGAFDRALSHVRQREQFGQKLIEFQVIRHKLSEMITLIETARLITRRAALVCDQGRGDAKSCSMAKFVATQTAIRVTDHALQLLGGYGYMDEYDVEGYYRDAKMLEILEGNNHLQKDIIADTIA
jgi:alkylation response protein AidB-like acyl-CoA dehydrogenase